MGQKFQVPTAQRLGPQERRRQLHFQRTFCRNVLEAVIIAAVAGEAPGPSLLRSFAALERAAHEIHKPATIALRLMLEQREERDPAIHPAGMADTVPDVPTGRESARARRRALAETARAGNLAGDLSA